MEGYGFKQSQSQFLTPTDGNCGPEGKYLYIYILNSRGFICIHIFQSSLISSICSQNIQCLPEVMRSYSGLLIIDKFFVFSYFLFKMLIYC